MAGWHADPSSEDVDPKSPHRFQPVDDPGIAAAASGLGAGGPGGRGGYPSAVIMTDNFLRKSVCGVPGCEKPRSDPIHVPAD